LQLFKILDNKSIWAYNNGIVNKKELEMFNDTIHYGMFTEEGNLAVGSIVRTAKLHNLPFNEVLQMLRELSNVEGFGEVTDTAVYEYVYGALYPQGA